MALSPPVSLSWAATPRCALAQWTWSGRSLSPTGHNDWSSLRTRADKPPSHRHWQDSGYLIVYVTGRPDMQKHRVVAWLSQHNFPHGVVSFCDGLTHDPLRQKAMFLQSLVQEVRWLRMVLACPHPIPPDSSRSHPPEGQQGRLSYGD